MDRLYATVRPLVPSGAAQHELFCDVAKYHGRGIRGAERLPEPGRAVHPAVLPRAAGSAATGATTAATPELHEQFTALHDAAFPGTYAPAAVLLAGDRASTQPILVAVDGDTLLGYVALKLRPEFDEAQIQYLAVSEAARGQGIGASLLTAGLHRVFADDRFSTVDLVTNNPAARRLYERVGFTLLGEMRSFRTS